MTAKQAVCPACKRPIDPARAPYARVREAKVVTFCSEECASRPEPWPETAADASPKTSAGSDAADRSPLAEVPERAPRMSSKRRVVLLSAAVAAGGMVITIIGTVSPSTPSNVSAASSRGAHDAIEPDPDPASADRHDVRQPDTPDTPRVRDPSHAEPAGEAGESAAAAKSDDPEALRDHAVTALREMSRSPSPRLGQLAAMALARTGDAEALTALAALRKDESSELGVIAIDYALARAGDADAVSRLRTALGNKRRDIRLDAARALVQLGDRAGVKLLRRTLRLSSHRLGVAGLLARLGDDEGISVLRKTMSDDRSSVEDGMRATVALGRAGDDSVRVRLVEILRDGRYHVGAAEALAVLGDPVAVPALVAQLDLPSMRVRAALGLRRLGAAVELAPLALALDQGSDRGRVTAAEALVILTGPAVLAERD